MRNSIIDNFQKRVFAQTKVHPDFRPGDTLRVHYKIEEAAKVDKKDKKAAVSDEKKFRIQIYEGVCISYRKGGLGDSTFAVRKIGANSVGVERVFPLHSPFVDKIEIVSGGRVRRSRLYYLRDLSGKAARIRARRLPAGMATSTLEIAAPAQSAEA